MKQSGNKFRYSSCEKSLVTGVQFGLMSEQEIREWTVDELKKANQADINQPQGLCDPRLGISGPREKCKTCLESLECPGHFGRIELAKPIYHIGYINQVVKILKCICYNCGRLKVPVDPKQKDLLQKYKTIISST